MLLTQSSVFSDALAGVTEPQQKRKRIGSHFIECFKQEAEKISGAKYLAQGTLYPDVIESGAAKDGPAATIKLHHNVGGLPDQLGFELVEPLRDLFKDEVRKLGLELGLPEQLVWRHPFPGPGLAVRCLGEVTKEKLDILREADYIVVSEIKAAGLVPPNIAGLCGIATSAECGRHGRCPDLREHRCRTFGKHRRFHDCRLESSALRFACAD